ncbi:MAG: hypothetical protein WBG86_14030 [Polyangiales bacterium]
MGTNRPRLTCICAWAACLGAILASGCGSGELATAGGQSGGGGTGGAAPQCVTPADCGFNTVEMTRTCDLGECGHVDHPRGLCPDGLPCNEDEFCYVDASFADPDMQGVCVPDRCEGGGECVLDDGGVILIE